MTATDTPLAIIGLGYVGLPLAVEFGKQRPTIGFDINADRIAELQAGRDRTREVAPAELAQATQLTYTTDLEAIRDARIYIVTVPTPIDAHKRPDLTPLLKASETVGKVLKTGDIVIYESTVDSSGGGRAVWKWAVRVTSATGPSKRCFTRSSSAITRPLSNTWPRLASSCPPMCVRHSMATCNAGGWSMGSCACAATPAMPSTCWHSAASAAGSALAAARGSVGKTMVAVCRRQEAAMDGR